MSSPLEVIAIITPAEGKEKSDRIIEILKGVAKVVEEKESGTLRYEIAKQVMGGNPPKIFVLEQYKDVKSIKAHGQFPEFKAMRESFAKEGLVQGKMEVYVATSVGGVKSRL